MIAVFVFMVRALLVSFYFFNFSYIFPVVFRVLFSIVFFCFNL